MLATDASGKDRRTEYFTSGTQPTETDTLHQTANVCDESGYLATPSCPDFTEESGILRPYTPNKRVADIKRELPHYFCNLHNPDPEIYKVKKGLEVTIVQPGELDEEEPEELEGILNEDGSISYPDGTIVFPDGTVYYPDGTNTNPDGTIVNPDGSIANPDETQVQDDPDEEVITE